MENNFRICFFMVTSQFIVLGHPGMSDADTFIVKGIVYDVGSQQV